MTDFLAILRGAVTVADKRVQPHSGTFAPEGVLVHHTATKGAGLTVVQRGRPGLAGPLCNLNLTRLGLFNVVSDGLAWHAGSGSSHVLDEVRHDHAPSGDARTRGLRDDTTGNRYLIGIEVDNDGVGEPYPDVQIEALVKGCAALCRHFGWSANRVIHHREWTSRKIDMSYRGDLRGAVAAVLGSTNEEDDMTPEQAKQLAEAHQRSEWILGASERMDDFYRNHLPKIEEQLAAGGGGTVDLEALAEKVADKLAARLKD